MSILKNALLSTITPFFLGHWKQGQVSQIVLLLPLKVKTKERGRHAQYFNYSVILKNRKQRLNTYLHTKSWKFRLRSITVTITKERKMLVYNFSLVDFPRILSLCNLARPSPSVFSHPKYICTYLGHTYSHQLHEARDLGAIHKLQINCKIFDPRDVRSFFKVGGQDKNLSHW